MKYKGVIMIALVMAAVFSVGFWLTEFSYKQKAQMDVENLTTNLTLAPTEDVSGATISSENWGDPATSNVDATPADADGTKARINTGSDGLDNIYFGVDNNNADNLSAFYDLKLKVYLSETGENTSVGWYDNKTITLVDDGDVSADNQTSFDNDGSPFAADVTLDIVYELYENTDNIGNTQDVTIPIEVWAEE